MNIEDFEKRKYQEVLDEMYRHIAERRRSDTRLTQEWLEGELKSLYTDQGNDWLGRGLVSRIDAEATIAAYEKALAEWRKESSSG